MTRHFLLTLLLLTVTVPAGLQAQVTLWTRTYGGGYGDYGYSVEQTTDGGYIIAGYTSSFGAGFGDVYLVKTDASGDTLWTRTYGGFQDDAGYSVEQTTDGGYIIAGYTDSFGAGFGDVYLVKTDASGDTLWTKTYGGGDYDYGYSVRQTTDGGYIIAGYTDSFGESNGDVYLVKTDASGDTLWTKTYGGRNMDFGNSVRQTTDDGYIIAGVTESFGAGLEDVYLVKTDASGNALWTKTYGGGDWDFGNSVQQTTDGGYIIAGWTDSFGAGLKDVYLVKTDASGDTLWTKTYGGGDWNVGSSVRQTTDGGYIIAGQTMSFGADSADVYLVKTDASGDTLWTKTYGGSYDDVGYSVRQTTDGDYIIAGYTDSFGAGFEDVYLIKVGPALGDLNRDGDLTVSDLTFLVNLILGEGSFTADDSTIADMNEDDGIDILDVVLLVRGILGLEDSPSGGTVELLDRVVVDWRIDRIGSGLLGASVGLSGGHVVGGMELRLHYDRSRYELAGIRPGSQGQGSSMSYRDDDGSVKVLIYGSNGLDGIGGGDVCRIDLRPLDRDRAGSPGITLEKVILSDLSGRSLDYELNGADQADGVPAFLPRAYRLYQNHPNPFNPSTTIAYDIPAGRDRVDVRLWVYDIRGRLVRRLVEEESLPGRYEVGWDGRDESGKPVGSGVYLCRISAGNFVSTRKLVLLK